MVALGERILSIFKRKEAKDTETFNRRHAQTLKALEAINENLDNMDGIIAVVIIDGMPQVAAGGIDNEYEGLGLLIHAMNQISTNGLPYD